MPETYRVKLSDGRKFDVESEGGPPSEAAVMAQLKSSTPAPYQSRDVLAEGRRSAAQSDTPDDAPKGGLAQWFEEKLRPMLEQVAHPQTISDIASLLIPDAGLTGTVRAGGKAIAATGRGVEATANAPIVQQAASAAGMAGSIAEGFHGKPGTAAAIASGAAVAPKVVAAGGRGLQRIGDVIERSAAPTPRAVGNPMPPVVVAAPAAVSEVVAPAAKALSPAQTMNELALAARRAKITLSPTDYKTLSKVVQEGAAPAEAVATLLEQRLLQKLPGAMSDADVASEIANRVGNRSPSRK